MKAPHPTLRGIDGGKSLLPPAPLVTGIGIAKLEKHIRELERYLTLLKRAEGMEAIVELYHRDLDLFDSVAGLAAGMLEDTDHGGAM